jgi:hypothetical protein
VGHIRLRRLPRTLKWDRVVSLLVAGQPAEEIAARARKLQKPRYVTLTPTPPLAMPSGC